MVSWPPSMVRCDRSWGTRCPSRYSAQAAASVMCSSFLGWSFRTTIAAVLARASWAVIWSARPSLTRRVLRLPRESR